MRTPEEGIDDLERIQALGLRGVMMPGIPGVEDYDSPIYDDFYEAAVDLGLPLSFHILTGPSGARAGPEDQRLPHHHPRLPGRHGHVRLRRASSSATRA